MKLYIWISLSSPDATTAKRTVLYAFSKKFPVSSIATYKNTHISYKATNSIMLKIEDFISGKFFKYVDVSY